MDNKNRDSVLKATRVFGIVLSVLAMASIVISVFTEYTPLLFTLILFFLAVANCFVVSLVIVENKIK